MRTEDVILIPKIPPPGICDKRPLNAMKAGERERTHKKASERYVLAPKYVTAAQTAIDDSV